MKKLLAAVLAMAMLFTTSCSSAAPAQGESAAPQPASSAAAPAEGSAPAGGDKSGARHLKFAWLVDNIDISQQAQFDMAQAYVDYLNDTRDDIQIELVLFDGLTTVDKQIADMETAMAMGCDALMLSCVDPDGLRPIAEQAMAEDFKVLDWRDMGGICTVTYVAANEHKKGEEARDWTRQYLLDHPDAVLYAGLQQGSPNHPNCFPRMQYMYDLEKEFPDRFKILVEQYSDWSSNTSMAMAEDWLMAYPEMNFISSSSEEQMLGVIEALRGAGKLDDFTLITFNGEDTGCEMLKKGEIEMDIGQTLPIFMQGLVEYTIKMVMEDYTGSVDLSDLCIKTLTPENVEEYQEFIQLDFYNKKYMDSVIKDSYN